MSTVNFDYMYSKLKSNKNSASENLENGTDRK